MQTKENQEIISQTIKTYLIIYISAILFFVILAGLYAPKMNKLAMIPIAIFALIKMKEKNLLIIKTILIMTIIITSLILVRSLLSLT